MPASYDVRIVHQRGDVRRTVWEICEPDFAIMLQMHNLA